MGVVYLARELRLDRRVAIKLLPPERALQPTARQRFLREARTAAQLSHPGIVPVFAVHEVSDFVYFAMAYVDGGTLGRRVRQRGPLPHDAAARLLEEVARALAYAHDRGVVHRDIKPDNILLDLATGGALVSDFGIARVGSDTTTGPQRVAWAVRVFVTEARHLSTSALLYGAFAAIALPLLAVRLLGPDEPPARAAIVAAAVAIVAVPLVVMVARVRRLRKAGYSQQELIDALRAELSHRREELAFLYGNGQPRLERALGRLCYVCVAAAGGIVLALEQLPGLAGVVGLPTLFGVATATALLAAVIARARTEHRTDPKAERRLRFWNGPLGRGLFMLAGLNLTPSKAGEVTPAPDARDA